MRAAFLFLAVTLSGCRPSETGQSAGPGQSSDGPLRLTLMAVVKTERSAHLEAIIKVENTSDTKNASFIHAIKNPANPYHVLATDNLGNRYESLAPFHPSLRNETLQLPPGGNAFFGVTFLAFVDKATSGTLEIGPLLDGHSTNHVFNFGISKQVEGEFTYYYKSPDFRPNIK